MPSTILGWEYTSKIESPTWTVSNTQWWREWPLEPDLALPLRCCVTSVNQYMPQFPIYKMETIMEKTQRELYDLIYVKCLGHCLAHSVSCLIDYHVHGTSSLVPLSPKIIPIVCISNQTRRQNIDSTVIPFQLIF